MTYKIFLSYSWANSAERRALENEIGKLDSIEILVDKTEIGSGDPIHSRISQMIDAANCVIVILTKEGLASRELLDEISRAHDRRKFIIPVVADDIELHDIPWHLREINFIRYDGRNFDDVVDTIVHAIRLRANPIHDPKLDVPESLKSLVEAGTRFIDIPIPPFYDGDSFQPTYIYCKLRMQKTGEEYVFRAANAMQNSKAAAFLAETLLPHMRRESYEWTFIRRGKELPTYHTLETSGVRSGDLVSLVGNHRMPRILPCRILPCR